MHYIRDHWDNLPFKVVFFSIIKPSYCFVSRLLSTLHWHSFSSWKTHSSLDMIILSSMFRIHLWHHSHHMWTLDFGNNLILIFNSLGAKYLWYYYLSVITLRDLQLQNKAKLWAEIAQCMLGLPHTHNRNISLSELSDMWAVKRNRWMTELFIWHILICGPFHIVGVSVLVFLLYFTIHVFVHFWTILIIFSRSSFVLFVTLLMPLCLSAPITNTITDHFHLPVSAFDPPSGFQYTKLYNGFVGTPSYTKEIGQYLSVCMRVCMVGHHVNNV